MAATVSATPPPSYLASTAASQIAIPAPCAANGSMAWAASPNSAIGPAVHSPPSGRVNSAHLRQSSTAPIIIRAVPRHVDGANTVLISFASPRALQPARPHVPPPTPPPL